MAIDFAKRFGSLAASAASTTTTTNTKPKAQYWLNIGYLTDQKDEQGEFRFVSLSSGIALDTMETLPVNSKNATFAMFQAARNDLRDQLIAEATQLKPGEAGLSEPIPSMFGLQIQIRRVSEETAAVAGESNPFSRKLVPPAVAPVTVGA